MAITTIAQENTAIDAALTLWPTTDALPVFSRNQATSLWYVSNLGTMKSSNAAKTNALLAFCRQEQDSIMPNASANTGFTVAVASTGNLTLSGEQTIDGVLTSASRILVKDQTVASQNGIYVTAAGAWARATDYDAAAEIQNTIVTVSGGLAGPLNQYLQPLGTVVVGTTSLVYYPVRAPFTAAIVSLVASLV